MDDFKTKVGKLPPGSFFEDLGELYKVVESDPDKVVATVVIHPEWVEDRHFKPERLVNVTRLAKPDKKG